MAVFTITQKVNENISVKSLTVFNGQAHRVHQGLWIISVHVQYRSKNYLGYIRTIGGGASILIIGGKTNLIINYYMQSTARLVTIQPFHLNGLINHSLGCDCRITVNQYWEYFFVIVLVIVVDLRSSYSFNNRIYRFQVRWIRSNIHFDAYTIRCSMKSGMTKMIFYISINCDIVKSFAFKFRKDLFTRFTKNICQYIKPSSVRHSQYKLFNTVTGCMVNGFS